MLARQPYTEPLTSRERLSVFVYGTKLNLKALRRDGFPRFVANKLPKRVAYFAYVRVFAHAWSDAGNKTPDDITYEDACKSWQSR